MQSNLIYFVLGLLLGLFEMSALSLINRDLKKRMRKAEEKIYALLEYAIYKGAKPIHEEIERDISSRPD